MNRTEYVNAVRDLLALEIDGADFLPGDLAVELRVDHTLVRRFRIGGKFKGLDPGTIIGVEEDDLEGQRIHTYRLTADDHLEVRVPVGAGTRTVAAAFTRTLPSAAAARARIGIDTLQVAGPYSGQVPEHTPSRDRLFVCHPGRADEEEPCARRIITTLIRRAYRRPATESDVRPLLEIYAAGRGAGTFDTGIERAVEALLSSPKFLMRLEDEPVDAGAVHRLSDLELASRLSFFLWKSIPDDELLDLAARGRLADPAVLAAEVRRMLADGRATRFMDDFVEQWLQVRNLHSHEPDSALFPATTRRCATPWCARRSSSSPVRCARTVRFRNCCGRTTRT